MVLFNLKKSSMSYLPLLENRKKNIKKFTGEKIRLCRFIRQKYISHIRSMQTLKYNISNSTNNFK